ncbi:tannase and feruloyl esterase [Zopfochytrium polystomum]|nr:tannase and feruloyl esterase [Zopfochytrium polystomum]
MLPLVSLAAADAAAKCASLATTLKIANTTVWFTAVEPAGATITFPDSDPSCATPNEVASKALCRVAMFVATSPRSNISLEAWLPLDNWNGRFLSTGNGGLNGCISYEDINYGVAHGFASVGANAGHNGTRGLAFYQNDDVVEDFVYRSVHTGVVVGKQVTKAFYGRPHKTSYYLGCSSGGREGFRVSYQYPDDFNGIVVGAPALSFTGLTYWSGAFYLFTGNATSPGFLSPDLWALVHNDILKQCDGLDGYVDGILEDPLLCNYTPESLLCDDGGNTTQCLTSRQVETVRKAFSPVYGTNGTLIYPRMQPGSEQIAFYVYYSGAPFIYTVDWMRYAALNDPTWDPASLSPATFDVANAKNPFNVNTWEGDLSRLRDAGVKILHYHGQMDAIISSDNSPRYYDHVAQTMRASPRELDRFYRFFRVSGMEHCQGGPGATFVGQAAASSWTDDPAGNVLTATVRWVEQGIAPDTITGVAYVNGTADSGVIDFTRRHCRYPRRNRYKGYGDPKKARNWECVL